MVDADHLRQAQKFKQLWSRLSQSRDLISVGAYVAGGDPETDLAIALQPKLVEFLRQGLDENVGIGQSRQQLGAIFTPPANG